MTETIRRIGGRKVAIILVYIAQAPLLVWITGSTDGVAAIMASTGVGVGAFMGANVWKHKVDAESGS